VTGSDLIYASAKVMKVAQSTGAMDPLESKVRSTSASPNSVHGGTVGASVTTIGPNVGSVVGAAVGRTLGLAVGTFVGVDVGDAVGVSVGVAEGDCVAFGNVGTSVGVVVGVWLGRAVGINVAAIEGENVDGLGGAAAMHGGKYISIVILTAAAVAYAQLVCAFWRVPKHDRGHSPLEPSVTIAMNCEQNFLTLSGLANLSFSGRQSAWRRTSVLKSIGIAAIFAMHMIAAYRNIVINSCSSFQH